MAAIRENLTYLFINADIICLCTISLFRNLSCNRFSNSKQKSWGEMNSFWLAWWRGWVWNQMNNMKLCLCFWLATLKTEFGRSIKSNPNKWISARNKWILCSNKNSNSLEKLEKMCSRKYTLPLIVLSEMMNDYKYFCTFNFHK